jgi:D-ribose pyranase
MKKTALLNAPISSAVARLGHGDSLCIGDAGLPVPQGVERIDLALMVGVPSALQVLKAVTLEMYVERAVIASELRDVQPEFHTELRKALDTISESQGKNIQIDLVSHEGFKRQTVQCQTVVRTGECTPFANVILFSGVTF